MKELKLKVMLMTFIKRLIKNYGKNELSTEEIELDLLFKEVVDNYFAAMVDGKDKNKERVLKRAIMEAVKYRNNLLKVNNQVSSLLIQTEPENFSTSLAESMKMMAEAVNVDRVYLWKNHMQDGELYTTQIYEWSEDVDPQQNNEYTVDIPYRETYPELIALADGKSMNNIVKLMSKGSREHLGAQGVVSILIEPIFLKGEFWGFLGFDDCCRERIFSNEEELFLQSISFLIANILLRNEAFLSVQESSVEAKKALEIANIANKAKSIFLSNISHEIRTPMNAIMGMANVGKKGKTLEEKDKALDVILDSSNHLLGIINDVLDMSKIEANKLELSKVEFSVNEILKKVINIINLRIVEKRQNFYITVDENIPQSLIGDDQRLTQVMINLISNAVKFTPEGGMISLEIKQLSESVENCFLQINVHDTGIGIKEEQKDKLFNSFEQAESGTTRKYGGTGLGLAISKKIIEKMGGKIWIDSEIDKGSTFSFTVMLDKVQSLSENNGKEEYVLEHDFSGRTILLVEDVMINAEIVLGLLEDTNIVVDIAENGKVAVEKFKANPDKYDAIFMDIQMPVMDGYEATKLIRSLEIESAREIPIIAMSANVFKEDIDYCMKIGMNDHVGKPIDVYTVFKMLSKYLKKRSFEEMGSSKVLK